MKKLLFIPAVLLTMGSLFMVSCGNGNGDATMKSPAQTNVDSANQKEKNESGEKDEKKEDEMKENEKGENNSTLRVFIVTVSPRAEGGKA